jgi:hypothetical protein
MGKKRWRAKTSGDHFKASSFCQRFYHKKKTCWLTVGVSGGRRAGVETVRRRKNLKARKLPEKRAESRPSAARRVRPHALTEPSQRYRTFLGAWSKHRLQENIATSPNDLITYGQANFYCQPRRESNSQEPAQDFGSGKRRWQVRMILQTFLHFPICKQTDRKSCVLA